MWLLDMQIDITALENCFKILIKLNMWIPYNLSIIFQIINTQQICVPSFNQGTYIRIIISSICAVIQTESKLYVQPL